ncbi:hypothetical protein M406DRAFT_323533 [Cryphonectria parasitica EP155]|uniref:Uncharacterized protein n=1 Tax=Cryphonectria parasitica (strain ATCC 38755 / EP155) TaxID=660469 RepID=A0A9P5CKT4_CRYP1|nr:uncharacterized protein M406DRAFT_323533 [Cryphonectria parasitica EP155]KAF3762393.1 hypothetical protein M406DRAFT_323533 [Cryphonectria parasitica EP155]
MEASSAKKGKAAASGHSSSSNYNNNGAGASSSKSASAAPPWANLPKAQDIVRCPQINWAQYAIEGEALNKLHNEQLSRPTLGTPALMAANGTFEFTGAANPDDGKRVEGISAPFNPLRDRKPSKGKGPRRGA